MYRSLNPTKHWESSTPSAAARTFRPPPADAARQAYVDVDEEDSEDDVRLAEPSGYGGIFNLEFSPDGRMLAAACQKKAVVLFDPLSHEQIGSISGAHDNCVNGIRFLDNRLFASCSDDNTIALWDIRNLKDKVYRLEGHSKWVKNIEYHYREQKIITSGFDGEVIAWDINRFSSETDSVHHEKLVTLRGLMRMKLSPDLDKMLLCTMAGYMLLLQNLSLDHLHDDMLQFMRMDVGSSSEELSVMGRKRNRPVVIHDFPASNRPEIIHSMQIHPHSWAVLSRNTSFNDESEWTCVHDIQEFPVADRPAEMETDVKNGSGNRVTRSQSSKDEDSDSSSSSRGTLPDSGRSGSSLRNFYTPRLDVLLDNRGGNWLDMRYEPRQGDDDQEEEGEDEERRDVVFALLGDENEGAEEEEEEADESPDIFEIDRRRTINYGLNVLLRRNTVALQEQLQALSDDIDGDNNNNNNNNTNEERRRRGGRGRAQGSFYDSYAAAMRERTADRARLSRNSWRFSRINRRLGLLSHRLSSEEMRNRLREVREETRATRRAIEDEERRNNEIQSAEERRINLGNNYQNLHQEVDRELRNWTIRNEIRQTLRNFRSGLDFVLENLYSAFRQYDTDPVTRGRLFHPASSRSTVLSMPPSYKTNYLADDLAVRTAFSQQRPRLTHYIEEANVGVGFIKELCFSADGRLICSPYKNGVRLLMFDGQCSEMSHAAREGSPRKLSEVNHIRETHNHNVVSTSFSPTHTLLVTGCLGGNITWHQPVL